MTDLIAQTAADLADLVADSTGTATDLLAIETATDLLADLKAAAPVITYNDIGPMVMEDHDGDYKWSDRRGETLQPVELNGQHVGNLARCYSGKEGEGMRLVFYHWRPVSPDHYLPLDEQDDFVFQYSSARAALAAKKAQIAAALGA